MGRAEICGHDHEGRGMVLLVFIDRRGRDIRRRNGSRFLLLLLFRDDFGHGVGSDDDTGGATRVHRQDGRQFRLRLVFNPLSGEIVGDGEKDRALDIIEGTDRAQYRRSDEPQLIDGDYTQGRNPHACEGTRLHSNLRS